MDDSEVKNAFLVVPIAYVLMSEHFFAGLSAEVALEQRIRFIHEAKKKFEAMSPKELVNFLRTYYPMEQNNGREQADQD